VERSISALTSIVERNSNVVFEASVRIVCVSARTAATARDTSGRSCRMRSYESVIIDMIINGKRKCLRV
jgi:hypothetical protein